MSVLFGYLAVLVIVGALLCFKGQDLFRPIFAVFVFWMTASFVLQMDQGAIDDRDRIIAVLAGLAAALLAGFVLKAGVFLAGMILGLGIGAQTVHLFPQLAGMEIPPLIYIAVVTVLVMVLTVKAVDVIILVATSGIGAALLTIPCVYMLYDLENLTDNIGTDPVITMKNLNHGMFDVIPEQQPVIVMAATLAVFAAGLLVQSKRGSHFRKKRNK